MAAAAGGGGDPVILVRIPQKVLLETLELLFSVFQVTAASTESDDSPANGGKASSSGGGGGGASGAGKVPFPGSGGKIFHVII